ncbi:hypothetical protein QBC39DRAFT_48958 [Podospora conica]|nr:hypothetical protein QBC39DRAFT_48958 [Schizothecium conicum]
MTGRDAADVIVFSPCLSLFSLSSAAVPQQLFFSYQTSWPCHVSRQSQTRPTASIVVFGKMERGGGPANKPPSFFPSLLFSGSVLEVDPPDQQNGIFEFLHSRQSGNNLFCHGKHENAMFGAPGQAPSPSRCQLFDPACQLFSLLASTRFENVPVLGTPSLLQALLHRTSDGKDSRNSRNSGSAQPCPTTDIIPTSLPRRRGSVQTVQTADQSYDSTLVLIGQEVPPRHSPTAVLNPSKRGSVAPGHDALGE